MSLRKYFIFLTVAALFLVSGSGAIFAQNAPVRGKVELKKADGTSVPVSGAIIDVYRTDPKGKLPSGKSDKKGGFAFVGLPLGQVVMLVVSAPGAQPQVFPNIKGGMEGVTLTMYEGDGKRLTEDEARQVITAAKMATTGNTATGGTAATPAPPLDEVAIKKAQAEYQKQVADVTAKNKRVENINQVIDKVLNEGKAAFDAKNYDLAIAKYDEGINADPEFAGTAPVFLNNKAVALKLRGFDSYKKAATDAANKANLLEASKRDLTDAANAFEKSLAILKTATTTDAKVQKNYESYKLAALAGLVETRRLLIATRADQSHNKEAVAALEEYIAMETDPAAKLKTQNSLADSLRLAGDSPNAVLIYRKVLATAPDNADAMGGLGLSLFDVGVSNTDKAQMQEGLNMMERFTQIAPDTHPLKADVKGAVDYLKNTEKLVPQKVSKPAGTTTKKKS
jgi:tetratricopeptide (TPR) repeat protein